jgi:hypothetical protein
MLLKQETLSRVCCPFGSTQLISEHVRPQGGLATTHQLLATYARE